MLFYQSPWVNYVSKKFKSNLFFLCALYHVVRNSSPYSNSTFKIHKRIIRIIMNAGYRDSCCPLFKKLNFLPLYSQYIFSLSIFEVKNTDDFRSNSAKHNIDIRQGFLWLTSSSNKSDKSTKKEYIILKLKLSIIYH